MAKPAGQKVLERLQKAVAAAERRCHRLEAEEAKTLAELERIRSRDPKDPDVADARKELPARQEDTRKAEHAVLIAELKLNEAEIAAARAALRKSPPNRRAAAQARLDRLIVEKQRAMAQARTALLKARSAEQAVAARARGETRPSYDRRVAEQAHQQALVALERARITERSVRLRVIHAALAIDRGAAGASRTERQSLSGRVAVMAARLRGLERTRGVASAEYRAAIAELADARKALAVARTAERTASDRVAGTVVSSLPPDPADEIARLSARHPIALFPVRIETRFTFDARSGPALRVRMYPDEILAPTHDPRLTRSEVEAGQTYWTLAWDPANTAKAWSALAAAIPAERAAWILKAMKPANEGARNNPPQFPPAYADPMAVPATYAQRVDATLLPDRWLVVCYRAGREVARAVSAPVREPLPLTVSGDVPDADLVDISGDGLRLDRDMLWTIDYARAEGVGMAVTVTGLTSSDLDAGFDRVVVVGVKGTLAAADAKSALGELFAAHRYGSGLALVRQGTPTNNTGRTAAGYPPDESASRSQTRELDGFALTDASDGNRLLRAIGLSDAAVTDLAGHLDGADRTEDVNGRAMCMALWPVTWGYALEQMLDPEVSAAAVKAARQFFVDDVRGRGPLPAFRIGPVPYGVLPTTSIDRWESRPKGPPIERALAPLLARLRTAVWLPQASQVARAGRTPQDPDKDLIEMLGLDASAREVRVRATFSTDFYRNLYGLWGIADNLWNQWAQTAWTQSRAFLSILGISDASPRSLDIVFDESAPVFSGPLVGPDPLSNDGQLNPNYINWIAGASVDELREATAPPGFPGNAPLLYVLLRHAALLAYGDAAFDLHEVHSREAISRREMDVVRIAPGTEGAQTVIDRLNASILAVDARPLKVHVRTAAARAASPLLADYQVALEHLATLAPAELERLMAETLDLASSRLDAWITALAWHRLKELRQLPGGGTYVGAFAWVENLRPAPSSARISRASKDGRALTIQTGSGGHIHAPSMPHAAAAAVLRNAHLTRSPETRGRYAIDLSSRRVRLALWLLDAVRAGQPLAAVFGYLVERGLDEAQLQVYKEPLRQLYPMAGLVDTPAGTPTETIVARDVVNGWTLYQAADPLAGLSVAAADRPAVEGVVRQLRDAADAVADLLTANAVYDIVSGGTTAAASSLDALSKGARPVEPEIAHSPRGGTVLTHRIAVALNAQAAPDVAGWTATARATAEPALNAWVGQILGDPASVRCRTTYKAPRADDPDHREPLEVRLSQLRLAPLDLVALAKGVATAAAASELDRCVALLVLAAAPEDSDVQITYEADPAWDRNAIRTFLEILEIARAIDVLIGAARPLRPEDLVLPEGASAVQDADRRLADATARADAARQALATARADLFDAANDVLAGTAADLDALRDALSAAAAFGVPGAVPSSAKGTSARLTTEMLAQARSVLREIDVRTKREATQVDPKDRVATLFGGTVRLVPTFDVVAAAELTQALGSSAAVVGDAFAPMKWFQGSARVHAGAGRLRRVGLYAGALGAPLPAFEVAQLPFQAGAQWVALPFASEEQRPPSGRVSIALIRPTPRPLNVPWAGLMIDEWTERIPLAVEQTGLAFHYDDPGAEAAQTVLIAVPPNNGDRWDLDALLAIVNETFDLAKIRAVDRDLTPALAQVLPAIYLASNSEGETIETNLAGRRLADATIAAMEPT